MPRLLCVGHDAKTIKGEKFGYLTGVMYLAPHKLSGINLCPNAELAGCHEACLYTAGRGVYQRTQKCRVEKTMRFLNDRDGFMSDLVWDIHALIRKAKREGLIPCVRLNGTSDIRWEKIDFSIEGKRYKNIMELFSDIQFYDYTKLTNRRNIPANYDLTFSFSNLLPFRPFIRKAFERDYRVAVVFERHFMPEEFLGRMVVNGDDSDLRFIEDRNVIVGLKAKGKARKSRNGFVVRPGDEILLKELVA